MSELRGKTLSRLLEKFMYIKKVRTKAMLDEFIERVRQWLLVNGLKPQRFG